MMRRIVPLVPLALAACAPAPGATPAATPAFVVAPTPPPAAPSAAPTAAPTAPPALEAIAGAAEEGLQDGPGAGARFDTPIGLAIGADGDLYVADSQNHRIRRIDLDAPGFPVSTVAGTGAFGREQDGDYQDGSGTRARFFEPSGLAAAPDGSIYVADAFNHRVRRLTFSAAGTTVSTVAGSGQQGGTDGEGTAASFRVPYGVALGADGSLYVSDHWGHDVRKIADPAGQAKVTTLAGKAGAPGYQDARGDAARFDFPAGLATDAAGNVYVLEARGCHLRRVEPDGNVLTMGANTTDACGFQDGDLEGAKLSEARQLAAMPGGQGLVMIVGDAGNQRVRRLDVVDAAGNGTARTLADEASGLVAPVGVAVAKDGTIYVADGNRILRFKP